MIVSVAAACACDGIRHPPSAFGVNLLLESASTPGCLAVLLSSVVVVPALAACSTSSSPAIVLAGLVIVPRPLTLKCDMKQKISDIFNIRCLFFWYLIRLAARSKKGCLCHLFISRVRPIIEGSLLWVTLCHKPYVKPLEEGGRYLPHSACIREHAQK